MKYFISLIITMTALTVSSMFINPRADENLFALDGENGVNQLSVATDFDGGDGTEVNPWQIANADQLAFLAQEVNSNNILINHPEAHFVLTDDILLNDTTGWENWGISAPLNTWTPIGFDSFITANARPFVGVFDGDGFTVRGIYISNELYDQGLFGFANGATIKNLTIEEGFIRARNHVGGIIGHGLNTTIYNATNSATIHLYKTNHSSALAGGIAGIAHTILNSVNHGAIIAEAMTINEEGTAFVSSVFVGGIVGRSDFRVANSKNTGSVTAYSRTSTADAGGIAGQNPALSTVINCINLGSITANSSSTSGRPGGIVGSNAGRVLNTYSVGSVVSTSATRWVGGIAGFHSGAMVENSFWLRTTDNNVPVPTGAGAGSRFNFAHFNNNGLFFTGTPQWPNATTLLLNDEVTKRTNCVFEMLNVWVTNEHLNNRNSDLLFFARPTNNPSDPNFHNMFFVTYAERNAVISDVNVRIMNDQAGSGLISAFDVLIAETFRTELVKTDRLLLEITVETGQFIDEFRINGVAISVSANEPESVITTIDGLHFRAWWSQFELESPSGIWIELTNVTETVDIVADIEPMIYTIAYRNVLTGADNTANPTMFTMFDTVTLTNPTGTVPGFIFSHWSLTEGGSSISGLVLGTIGNTEIWAVWTLINYTITYNFNSSTGKVLMEVTNDNPETFNIATPDIALRNPSLIGYDFDGWFTDSAMMVPISGIAIVEGSIGNRTFYARFVPNIYTIAYNFYSSTGVALTGVTNANPANFTVESLDITLVNPSLVGYDFDGWFLEATHTTLVTGVAISEGSTGDRTFYARFVPITYTITYVYTSSTGGVLTGVTNVNPINFTIETLDIILVNPSLSSFDFDGWFTDATHTNQVTGVAISEGSIGNRTFYARFVPVAYTITYNFNSSTGRSLTGVTNNNPGGFDTESADITLINASLAGYDFDGWFLDSAHLIPVTGIAVPEGSVGNRTFYARFTPITYTINYVFTSSTGLELSGITNTNPVNFTIESLDIILTDLSLTGYNFEGWFLEATHVTPATGIAITEDSIGNRTFYARFVPIVYTISYVFTSSTGLELTGVTNTNPGTFMIESLDITLANPSLAGYDFDGWFTDATHTTQITGVAIVEGSMGDRTFYGRFTPIDYTITFDIAGGDDIADLTVTFNEAFILPTPIKTGHTFDGWLHNGNPFVSGTWDLTTDITLIATWTANDYTIMFDVAGGDDISDLTVTFNQAFILPTPMRTGFTFDGWLHNDNPFISGIWDIANNITLIATWKANDYTVVFNVDGGNYLANQIVTFGQSFNLPAPTRTGFTFTGWYDDTTSVSLTGIWIIARNVTLIAAWTANTYTITYSYNRPENATHNIRGAMSNSTHQFGTVSYLSPNAFNLIGWTFQGWLTSDNQLIAANISAMDLFAMLDIDYYNDTPIVLRAHWLINTYQVLFLAEDGVTVLNTGNTARVFGSLIESLNAPLIEGKVFVRWDGFISGQAVSGNHTFKAIYITDTTSTPAQRFTVTFNNADGEVISNHNNVVIGTPIATLLPENPTMNGKIFIGWDVFISVNQTVISDLVLTAVFAQVEMRTVEFAYRDEFGTVLIKRINVPLGTQIATLFPLAPTFAGKTFIGWSGYTDDMIVNDNITLIAEYIDSVGQFVTIRFLSTETNLEYTRVVASGTLLSLIGMPILQREGYVFLGWSGFDGDELTEDLTLTAMWESLGVSNQHQWPLIVGVIATLWFLAVIILIVVFKLRKRRSNRPA